LRVRDCRKCRHYRERYTVEYRYGLERSEYKHPYGFCQKHRKRCADVLRCDSPTEKMGQTIMDDILWKETWRAATEIVVG